MKIFLIFILSFSFEMVWAQSAKSKKLSPFQASINKCFGSQISVSGLSDNKKLYIEIVKNFPLQASETFFREVIYIKGGEKKKLRFEDANIKIYKLDSEDKVQLLSSDSLSGGDKDNGLRYKVSSFEAKLAQLLNGAEIKSDFTKTTEYRSKQLVLNIVWADEQIKNLTAQFESEKKKLDCQKKESADICECID